MTLQETNAGLKDFGSEKENVMKLKAYEICLQLLYENRDTVAIRALALPNICLTVGGQYMNVAYNLWIWQIEVIPLIKKSIY